jgi:hypothetical protein
MMTVFLSTLSGLIWFGIVLAGNDSEELTKEFWRLLFAAFVLNILALIF